LPPEFTSSITALTPFCFSEVGSLFSFSYAALVLSSFPKTKKQKCLSLLTRMAAFLRAEGRSPLFLFRDALLLACY